MPGEHKKFTIINIPELSRAEERFVELERYRESTWIRLSGLPANALEKYVTRPKLSRLRGAWTAVQTAKRAADPVIVSHAPRMTAAVARLASIRRMQVPHIGFSFNFTELPINSKLKRIAPYIARVDRLVVFSDYEAHVYAAHFGMPLNRFSSTRWTQNAPPIARSGQRPFDGPYLCAVGGEGRDYRTLVEATRICKLPVAIIARPQSLVGLDLPNNVCSFSNLPLDLTWEIASQSIGLVVPLLDLTSRCGLVTIVSAALLGLPVITNRTHVLAEYLNRHVAGPLYAPGDADGCSSAMQMLFDDAAHYRDEACGYIDQNRAYFDRGIWSQCLDSILDEFA